MIYRKCNSFFRFFSFFFTLCYCRLFEGGKCGIKNENAADANDYSAGLQHGRKFVIWIYDWTLTVRSSKRSDRCLDLEYSKIRPSLR